MTAKPDRHRLASLGLKKNELEFILKEAILASKKAGKNSLRYFEGSGLQVHSKGDQSPVTKADREAESLIRDYLTKKFPTHRITGEEFGESGDLESKYRWWIDPIDGTLQFIRGLPFWGSVLGLEYQGEMVVGVLYFPALKLCIWARKGGGCYANGKKVKVAKNKEPQQSLLLHSSLKSLTSEEREALFSTAQDIRDNRGIGDAFGHSLVIRGIADAMVDFRVNPYDISAVKICLEEAGGLFTGLSGEKTIYERGILSSNAALHPYYLKKLSPTPSATLR
jgi:histidinol phosphatase-like enzyme (inositol monophosphatase family)